MNRVNEVLKGARERDRKSMEVIVNRFGLSSAMSIVAVNEFHDKWINDQQQGGFGDGK